MKGMRALCSSAGANEHPRGIPQHTLHAPCVTLYHDLAVASLRANAADLGARVEQCRQDALRENRRGQKRAALMQLRRIRQLHTKRDSRLVSLYTLETALDQVG